MLSSNATTSPIDDMGNTKRGVFALQQRFVSAEDDVQAATQEHRRIEEPW
jgi:hypothetical protein